MKTNNQDSPITFPSPTADWGKVTHALTIVRNPCWRWWAFWRPKYIIFTITLDLDP